MGVIKLTKQESQYFLMNTLDKKEVVQEQVHRVLSESNFKGAVPFEVTESRGKKVIVLDVTGTYSFLTRLQSPIASGEFVLMVKGLLDSIKDVSSKKIPPTFVDLDLDYIFIKRDGSVLLTVWCLDGLAPKCQIPDLFKRIGDEAKPVSKRDENFIGAYQGLFDQSFSLDKLDKFIMSNYEMIKTSAVEDKSTPTPVMEVRATQKEVSATIPTPTPSPVVVAQEDEMLMPTGKTTILADMSEFDEDDGKTSILVDNSSVTRVLFQKATDEKFNLSDGETIIGKQADISIRNNKAISRRHAKFVVFDGVVTIEDLGSSNGTKLNGEKLFASEPKEVTDGDVIELANEVIEYREE